MARSFEELVDEPPAAPFDGWDFSWLEGRIGRDGPFRSTTSGTLIEARKPA